MKTKFNLARTNAKRPFETHDYLLVTLNALHESVSTSKSLHFQFLSLLRGMTYILSKVNHFDDVSYKRQLFSRIELGWLFKTLILEPSNNNDTIHSCMIYIKSPRRYICTTRSIIHHQAIFCSVINMLCCCSSNQTKQRDEY